MKQLLAVAGAALVAGFALGYSINRGMSKDDVQEAATLAAETQTAQEAAKDALDSLAAVKTRLAAIDTVVVERTDTVSIQAARVDSLLADADSALAKAVRAERQLWAERVAALEEKVRLQGIAIQQYDVTVTRLTEQMASVEAERDFWREQSGGSGLDVNVDTSFNALAVAGGLGVGFLAGWLSAR